MAETSVRPSRSSQRVAAARSASGTSTSTPTSQRNERQRASRLAASTPSDIIPAMKPSCRKVALTAADFSTCRAWTGSYGCGWPWSPATATSVKASAKRSRLALPRRSTVRWNAATSRAASGSNSAHSAADSPGRRELACTAWKSPSMAASGARDSTSSPSASTWLASMRDRSISYCCAPAAKAAPASSTAATARRASRRRGGSGAMLPMSPTAGMTGVTAFTLIAAMVGPRAMRLECRGSGIREV
uniref:Uncharacterized protein n=1 Tax=uncultured bacterium TB350_p TaxID=1552145 RepID=A0A0K0LBL1_9BACT|nr:hypothetical protein [uncultured bacterium TB350_p]